MLREAVHMGLSPLVLASKYLQNLFEQPALILLYHRVTTLAVDPQLLAVTPANFRAQMRHLKDNYSLARLEDNWSRLDKPAVVITFDDGYADNALEALPILEELQIPATFFVATSLVGTDREFWWDEVERLLLAEGDFPTFFELSQGRTARRWPTGEARERAWMYREVLPIMKESLPEVREDLLDRLRSWCGAKAAGRATHRVLSRDELRRLAGSPMVTLGAHTINHSALSMLPLSRQREEILGSKLWLEDFLAQQVKVFSYPFGSKGDYTAETVALCQQAGFSMAAANYPDQWRAGSDPYQLPRQIVRNWDLSTFKKNMSRFWIS